jgi:hypothetical protein
MTNHGPNLVRAVVFSKRFLELRKGNSMGLNSGLRQRLAWPSEHSCLAACRQHLMGCSDAYKIYQDDHSHPLQHSTSWAFHDSAVSSFFLTDLLVLCKFSSSSLGHTYCLWRYFIDILPSLGSQTKLSTVIVRVCDGHSLRTALT